LPSFTRQLQHAVLQRQQVLEGHGLHLGDADLEDDEERQQEEQQQEGVGHADDGAAAAEEPAQAFHHCVSTTWAERDQCAHTGSPQVNSSSAVALRVGHAHLQQRAAGQLQVVDREAPK
jgi:hypothetical protein